MLPFEPPWKQKTCYLLVPETHSYVCVSGVRNVSFSKDFREIKREHWEERVKLLNETCVNPLTHFSPMSYFYTPWKRQKKTYGFLTFSGGVEMWHWTKMG